MSFPAGGGFGFGPSGLNPGLGFGASILSPSPPVDPTPEGEKAPAPGEDQIEGAPDITFDYDAAFEATKDAPLRADRIGIQGLGRTKLIVVARELVKVQEAETLEEVKEAVLEAYANLSALDTFEAIDITIEASPRGPGLCDVQARFAEKSMLRVQSGSYVQGTEGSLEVSAGLTNPLGHAEQVSASAEWGSQSTTLYSLGVRVPRLRGHSVSLDCRLHQSFRDLGRWSSLTDLLRGGTAGLTSEDGRHSLTYELGWHRLADPSRTASRAVQAQLGDSLKSSVTYSRRENWLVGRPYPYAGHAWDASLELAGLGVDPNLARFVKPQGGVRFALPLLRDVSLGVALEGGLLLPFGGLAPGASFASSAGAATPRGGSGTRPTSIVDRFFLGGLGGSGTLRGFAQRGAGPTDARRHSGGAGEGGAAARARDALGGDAYATLLLSLNFPLPDLTHSAGIYGQLFLNGGSAVSLSGGSDGAQGRHSRGLVAATRGLASDLTSSLRWSIGAGIVWPTRIGRLELNYCHVLKAGEYDRVKRGIQFGFSPPQ